MEVHGGALRRPQLTEGRHHLGRLSGLLIGTLFELSVPPPAPQLRGRDAEGRPVEPGMGLPDLRVVLDRSCECLRYRIVGDAALAPAVRVDGPPEGGPDCAVEVGVVALGRQHTIYESRGAREVNQQAVPCGLLAPGTS